MNRLGENRKIGESVEDSDDLIKGLGQARELDKPVIGNVISPYASRIAKLKDETLGLKALVKSLLEDRIINLTDCQVVFEKYKPVMLL